MIKSSSYRSNSSLSSVSSEDLPEVVPAPGSSSSSSPVRIKMVGKRMESGSSASSKNPNALACGDEMMPSESESDSSEWVIDENRRRAAAGRRPYSSEDEDDTKSRNPSTMMLRNGERVLELLHLQKQEWNGVSVKREYQNSPGGAQDSQNFEAARNLDHQSNTERKVLSWEGNCLNLGFHRFTGSNVLPSTSQQNAAENPRPRRQRRPRLQLSMKICKDMILEMMSKSNKAWFWPFYRPIYKGVNGMGTGNVFEHPIYLSEIKAKVMDRKYSEAKDFVNDMQTLLSNFLDYYDPDHEFHKNAVKLHEVFEKGYEKLKELGKTTNRSQRRIRARPRQMNHENEDITKQETEIQEKMALSMPVRTLPPSSSAACASATSSSTAASSEINRTPPETVESNLKSGIFITPESKKLSVKSIHSTTSSATTSQSLNTGSSTGFNSDLQVNMDEISTPISAQNLTVPKRRIEIQSISDSITKKIKKAKPSTVQNKVASVIPEPASAHQPCSSNQLRDLTGNGETQALSLDANHITNLEGKASSEDFGCQWLMIALNQLTPTPAFSEKITQLLGQDSRQLQETQLRKLEPDKLSAVAQIVVEFLFPTASQRNCNNYCRSMVSMEEASSQWLKMQELHSAAQKSTCETMIQMQRMQEHGIKTYQRIFESRKFNQDPPQGAPTSK